MYEENLEPLPRGNLTEAFAPWISEFFQREHDLSTHPVTHHDVLFWARPELQDCLARISRRLLLPGSGVDGLLNLAELIEWAEQGSSCILCLNHRSNLDVPTLSVLLNDGGQPKLFQKIVWIAGRKLQEDAGLAGVLVQAYHRVIVTPRTWSKGDHTPEEIHEGELINVAALRAIREFRHQGWVFALFPTGTRMRVGDPSTGRAIPEIDSYLKSFDRMLLGHIAGCTLPVTRDLEMDHETPRRDRVRVRFGDVLSTVEWRREAADRYPHLDQRNASAQAIMQDIAVLDGSRDELL